MVLGYSSVEFLFYVESLSSYGATSCLCLFSQRFFCIHLCSICLSALVYLSLSSFKSFLYSLLVRFHPVSPLSPVFLCSCSCACSRATFSTALVFCLLCFCIFCFNFFHGLSFVCLLLFFYFPASVCLVFGFPSWWTVTCEFLVEHNRHQPGNGKLKVHSETQ